MKGYSTAILFTAVTLLPDFILLLRIRFFLLKCSECTLFMLLKTAFLLLKKIEMGGFNPHFVVFHMKVFNSGLGKAYLQLNNKGALLMLISFCSCYILAKIVICLKSL